MKAAAAQFFRKASKWKAAFNLLREIIMENKLLEEDFKWMHPCYTYKGKNIVLIHGFKDYCALLFHKGALINDDKNILIRQTANVQSARQIRFTGVAGIMQLKKDIKEYIKKAIEVEQAGRSVELKQVSDYPVPEEFKSALKKDQKLKKAFAALTPGRQKGYLVYFNQAKQPGTRQARIEKYYQHILNGRGLTD